MMGRMTSHGTFGGGMGPGGQRTQEVVGECVGGCGLQTPGLS